MRMPYIGGRGPDYTTKLNLMYNLRGAVAVEGSRGKTSGPVESEAGEGRRRPRRGRGWGPHSGEQCRPRKTRSGRNSRGWSRGRGSQKGHRHPPADAQGRVVRRVQTPTSTRNNPDASSACNLPRKVTPRDKSRGRLLEARGDRSPPRSESL